MKLWAGSSGGETQNGEDRVGRGPLRFASDPVLHAGQSFGSLVDIVTVGDVSKSFEQLFEAVGAAADGRVWHEAGTAGGDARDRPQLVELFHPVAFPLGQLAEIAYAFSLLARSNRQITG